MSLDIVGSLLSNPGEDFVVGHSILQRREYVQLAARNTSTTANNTINLFIDGLSPHLQYAASIVSACAQTTVYALQCTAGSVGSATCGPTAPIGIVTEAASTYKVSISSTTRTLGYDVTATAQDVCVLKGTTEADCAATLAVSAAGTSTTVSASTTYTGANYYRYDVQVTGGAEKLVNPTACANSAPKGLNTKAVAVLSLLSAVGAAGLLAV